MKYEIIRVYEGSDVEDESTQLTIIQLCHRCNISSSELIELIQEGIIESQPLRAKSRRFSLDTVERVRRAQRLKSDLELNVAGVALAMQLLDRIDDLERKLSRL